MTCQQYIDYIDYFYMKGNERQVIDWGIYKTSRLYLSYPHHTSVPLPLFWRSGCACEPITSLRESCHLQAAYAAQRNGGGILAVVCFRHVVTSLAGRYVHDPLGELFCVTGTFA